MVRTRTSTIVTHYVSDDEEHEFEVEHEPDSSFDPIVKVLPGGGWVVGYLVQDDDCQHPLDDCDGMGKFIDGRNDRKAWEERQAEKNPLDVFCDVYSHGMDAWRLHDSGQYFPDEQWDVSNFAGIWYADECCLENIELHAGDEYFNPEETWFDEYRQHVYSRLVEKPTLRDKPKLPISVTFKSHNKVRDPQPPNAKYEVRDYWTTYGYTIEGGKSRAGYKTMLGALKGCCRALGQEFDKKRWEQLCLANARLCAQQAIDEYNKWLSGDCWGVCVETFDEEGEPDNQDACWGCIGQEYAEQEVQGSVNYRLKEKPADDTEG